MYASAETDLFRAILHDKLMSLNVRLFFCFFFFYYSFSFSVISVYSTNKRKQASKQINKKREREVQQQQQQKNRNVMTLVNPNPTVFEPAADALYRRTTAELEAEDDDGVEDPIDAYEVFEMIRRIRDPEHPNTLEQLKVVEPSLITVNWKKRHIKVLFTPTVPHCSLTTLIGLSIRLQLDRSLPEFTKVDVYVTPGTHEQEEQVNKQLNDKERVAAALENRNLLNVVESCLNEFDE